MIFQDEIAMYDKFAITPLRCVTCDGEGQGGNGNVISNRSSFVVFKRLTHSVYYLLY